MKTLWIKARYIALLYLVAPLLCPARTGSVIRHYTTADGLVSNQCTNLITDRNGFLWILTLSGLSRFDGRHFTSFTTRDGLHENFIMGLAEDDSGRMWVATSSSIARFTGGHPHAFETMLRIPDQISFNCGGRGNFLYFLTEPASGLRYVTGSDSGSVAQLPEPVVTLIRNKEGLVFGGSQSGTIYVIDAGKVTGHFKMPSNDTLRAVMKNGPNGEALMFYYGLDVAYPLGKDGPGPARQLPRNSADLEETVSYSGHYYALCNNQVLLRSNGAGWDTLLRDKQIDAAIAHVTEDRNGDLWISTNKGLYRMTNRPPAITRTNTPLQYLAADDRYRMTMRQDSTLLKDEAALRWYRKLQPVLHRAYRAKDGGTWYCTTNGLYHLTPGAREAKQYLPPPEVMAVDPAAAFFTEALEDRQGRIWVSGAGGLYCYENGRFHAYGPGEGLDQPFVFTLGIDSSGTLYTAGNRVFALLPGRKRFVPVSAQLGLPADLVQRLIPGPDGKIWVCQRNSQLRKLDYRGDRFFIADSLALELNGVEVMPTSIAFDRAGNLYIAGRQLSVYLKDSAGRYTSRRHFAFRQPVADAGYPRLYSDFVAHLFLCYDHRNGNRVVTFDVRQLLQQVDTTSRRVMITGMNLSGKPGNWEAEGYKVDMQGVPIHPVFAADQNFLSFTFTATAASNPDYVAYRYRLRGLDGADWTVTDKTPVATYTALPPGAYILEVEASDGMGRWQGHLAYPFTILPPWYRTWWATLLWWLIALGAAAALIRLYIRNIKRRAAVQQLITEERLKALRAQINPHFIQNSFAFLAHQIGRVSRDTAIETIHTLSAYLRNVLYLSDEPVLTLDEELAFSEEYLRVQQAIMKDVFSYEIHVAPDAAAHRVEVPSMLLQPILENALKYGVAPGKESRICIRVWSEGPYIHCIVADTGNGVHNTSKPPGYASKGLAITLQRLQLLYRQLAHQPAIVQSVNASGGWDVHIRLPLF